MPTDEQYVPGQLYMITLNDLLPDSEQPRKYMEPTALKMKDFKWLSIKYFLDFSTH